MKNWPTFFLFYLLGSLPLLAQLSVGGIPPSFGLNSVQNMKEVEVLTLPSPDFEKIRKEDSLEDSRKDIPWRFGVAIEVDINLENSGSWLELPNGDRIWRVQVYSPGAKSININYDKFHMPAGARLFLYSNRKKIIGAFTSINNKEDSTFATRPIKGDQLSIEYFEPSAVREEGIINIGQIVHGYRDLWKQSKAFGASGMCEINVNCAEGMHWQDEKRAVAMVLVNQNTRRCTGTLINNVRQDSTPYFLSAGHCGIPSNSIFIFNYESEFCSPSSDGSLNHSINGAKLKATYFSTDFALFELSVAPPDSFNAFYAGWSAIDQSPLASTAIHHPMGDVKKISFDFDPAITTGNYGSGAPLYWQVRSWDLGTTENGSSGAALFDQNHRVIGQLYGGIADCGIHAPDWFGKFSDSWLAHMDSSKQLKYWLDPDNTGTLFVNALDSDTADYSLDAELLIIENLPNYSCDTILQPVAVIRNKGNDTLKSLDIVFKIENNPFQSVQWSGSLGRFEIAKVPLGNLAYGSGIHELSVATSMPNNQLDQNPTNDSLIREHQINAAINYLYFSLKTDNYGEETTWEIRDNSTNRTLIEGGPYEQILTGGKLYNDTLCLYDSCFNFIIRDSGNDGFTGQWGNGYYLLRDSNGDTVLFGNNFTGFYQTAAFCLDVNSSIKENTVTNRLFKIFPNPIIDGNFSVQTDIEGVELSLFNIQAKKIQSWKLDNSNSYRVKHQLPSGIYLLSLRDKNGYLYFKKTIVQ